MVGVDHSAQLLDVADGIDHREFRCECLQVTVKFVLEATLLIELLASVQTQSMTDATEHLSEISKVVRTDPAEELRKVQSKIVRKVAQKDEKTGAYLPHKFRQPEAGQSIFNVVIADTRGFSGGGHLEPYERIQLVWGAEHYIKRGGDEINMYWVGKNPLAGLFDMAKRGEEARLFRERIHLLGLVSEEKFGEDMVLQQTRIYKNPYLPGSEQASAKFTLAGAR
jgi:hypothetical protein